MTKEQAVELGKEAIYHATHKDAGSGGMVRVYHIIPDGWEKIVEGEDVDDLHYKYAHAKGLKGDGNETGMEYFKV